MGDDINGCRQPIKGNMALYIGGMGPEIKTSTTITRKALGFEDAAVKIQDLYLG